MSQLLKQNPGLGGLDELTNAEEIFITNLAALSYTTGDILYYDGSNLTNTDILFIDGGNSRVGIGTDSPDNILHIEANYVPTASASVSSPGIVFTDSVTGSNKCGIIPTQDARDIDFFAHTGGVLRFRANVTMTNDLRVACGSTGDDSKHYLVLDGDEYSNEARLISRTHADATTQPYPITFRYDDDRSGGIGDGEIMRLTVDGEVGIGTTSPNRILGIGGLVARNIGMERGTVANTAGFDLTLNAGGATSAATDKAGGDLILQSGISTGAGSSDILLQTVKAGAAGTADRSPATVMTILGSGGVQIGGSNIVKSVTKTVCASDSLDTSQCDYVCDGTADEEQINAAITAANTAGGGTVKLSEGTFNIAASIIIKDEIMIEGCGKNTQLNLINGANVSMIISPVGEYVDRAVIRDMTLYGNRANQSAESTGIKISAHRCIVENSKIYDFRDDGISLENISGTFGYHNHILNNHIVDCDDGVVTNSSDENFINNNHIELVENGIVSNTGLDTIIGNVIVTNSVCGIKSNNHGNRIIGNEIDGGLQGICLGAPTVGVIVSGNNLYVQERHAIELGYSSEYAIITDNTIKNPSNETLGTYSGIRLENAHDNIISNNSIYDDRGTTKMKHGIFEETYGGDAGNNIISNNIISGTTSDKISLWADHSLMHWLNNKLGIGETAPETKLEISDIAPYLTLHNTTEEDGDYGRESEIIFKGEQTGSEETTLGKIQVAHDGTSDDQKGIMTFKINDGDDGDAPSDAMTILANGNMGIGTTSPDTKLQVVGTTKLGDDNTNYASFAADGELALTGTARVKRHTRVGAGSWCAGASAPTQGCEGAFMYLEFDNSTDDEAFYVLPIPARWDNTTDIEFSLDWYYTGTQDNGTVCWALEYKSIKDGEAIAGGTTTIAKTSAGTHTTGQLVRTTFTTKLLAANLERGDTIGLRVFRDVDGGNDSGDTLVANARGINTHFRFIMNRLGDTI